MFARTFARLSVVTRSLALLAMVAIVAGGVIAGPKLVGAQSAGEVMVVNTDALNLRSDATVDADVVAVLDTGASVTVVDGPVSADGYDWYEVSTDAGDGWVDGEYLNDTLTYTGADDSTGASLVVNTDVLNLRSDASIDADVIAQLVTGEAVTVLDGPVSADDYDWYQVSTDYGDGWVVGDYLGSTVTVSTSSLGFSSGDVLVVATDSLNLRDDASTSGNVIATMVAGDSATIVDGPVSADDYTWYQVSTDYGTGWVAGEFLGTTVTLASTTGFSSGDAVVVDTDGLNLRADATSDGEVIAVLETGAAGTIVDGPVSADGYTWYEVTTDAGTGWVAGDYLALA